MAKPKTTLDDRLKNLQSKIKKIEIQKQIQTLRIEAKKLK
jgi:hypothetical protein